MSYSAGSIVADLTLDRTPFQEGLAEARADVRRFESEKHAIKLEVDASSGNATIDMFREKLTRLGTENARIAIAVDSASADAQIEHIREQFARLGMDTARLRIDVATAGASSAIADVETRLDRLASRVIRPRIEIDTAGLDATLIDVMERLDRLDRFRATPHIDLTGAAETAARLAAIDAQLRALGSASANIKREHIRRRLIVFGAVRSDWAAEHPVTFRSDVSRRGSGRSGCWRDRCTPRTARRAWRCRYRRWRCYRACGPCGEVDPQPGSEQLQADR